jgi:hypothetical protein
MHIKCWEHCLVSELCTPDILPSYPVPSTHLSTTQYNDCCSATIPCTVTLLFLEHPLLCSFLLCTTVGMSLCIVPYFQPLHRLSVCVNTMSDKKLFLLLPAVNFCKSHSFSCASLYAVPNTP